MHGDFIELILESFISAYFALHPVLGAFQYLVTSFRYRLTCCQAL